MKMDSPEPKRTNTPRQQLPHGSDPLEDSWIKGLARLLDSRFRIPGTGIRFGLDSLIGLIPGVGDTAGLFLSGIIPFMAASKGIRGRVLLSMAGNILLDYLMGSVPVLGDIFDVAFKANRRNLRLLQKELHGKKQHRAERWKMAAVLVFLVLLVALSITLMALVFRGIAALFGLAA